MKNSFNTSLSKLLRLILITALFTATLPANARFLQEDPMGFEAGDLNVYRYVGNNPVNRTDPSGMEAIDAGTLNAVAITALLVGVIAVKSDFLNGQTTSRYIRQTTNNSLSAIAGWWNCGAFAQGEFLGVAGEYENATINLGRCGANANITPLPPAPFANDRQGRYKWIKYRCDRQPNSNDRSCSNLSSIINYAKYCANAYQNWDDTWNPLRHKIKIADYWIRVGTASLEYKLKCNG